MRQCHGTRTSDGGEAQALTELAALQPPPAERWREGPRGRSPRMKIDVGQGGSAAGDFQTLVVTTPTPCMQP